MISKVDISPGEHATMSAFVGGGAVRGEGAADQRAAYLHVAERGHEQHVTVYTYGPQQTAELCDALASLVGQLLDTVTRGDVDAALATNIERNLGVAWDKWGEKGLPSSRLGSVADAVAEDAR